MVQSHFTYGLHAVLALLKQQPEMVKEIFILHDRRDARIQEIIAEAQKNNIALNKIDKKTLDKMVSDDQHQGVIAKHAVMKPLNENDLNAILDSLSAQPFLLLLDGIQDPHNLGACMRTAQAAGVHAIIAPKDRSVGLTPTVYKVASGAAITMPFIQVTNLARTIEALKKRGIWVVGADMNGGKNIFEADLSGPIAMVMGAEGQGLRRLTKDSCDYCVYIPMLGEMASLNVSVATGICLFEVVRHRL